MANIWNEDCITGMRNHIADESVDLIFTDPPFGIQGDKLDTHYNRDESNVVPGYVEVPIETYDTFSKDWINECERVMRPGASMYIVSGYTNLRHILNALHATKLQEVNHIIAEYTFGVYTKRKWVSSHYHVLFWTKKGRHTFNTHCRYDNTTDSYNDRLSVQTMTREYKPRQTKNKNQLPESFVEKFIDYSSNPGDTVLDPFAGSFSTANAANKLNRKFIGFEANTNAFNQFGLKLYGD